MQEVLKLRAMYKSVFDTDNGQKILKDLEARCNWRSTSYVAGDPNATAFEEGKRAVLLHIHSMMTEDK